MKGFGEAEWGGKQAGDIEVSFPDLKAGRGCSDSFKEFRLFAQEQVLHGLW